MPEVTEEQIARAELKNCPFCGFDNAVVERDDATESYWQVKCHSCLATTRTQQVYEDAMRLWNTRTQSEASSAARDAGWCSLEEWPRSADEFTGSYWSGIALLEPTENSCSLAAYLDFITYDAGVATWWASSEDGEDLHDIDPSKIIALYYLPNPPDRFNEREEAVKKALRERFPKRWYGAGNPFHKE